ncbi:MAG: hypothetical protein RJB66_178 [Pseudomonadota bacterium]|jgi:HAE1 family hydrophobic/amphiphilic exporter-1
MKIWEISIKRPIFMSSVLAALMTVGYFAFKNIPVELFPDINFPVVTVQTLYPGAGPNEIETLVSKPIEEELSSIAGIKNIRSVNRESVSFVICEFNLSMDIKYAEQQVRDKVASVKRRLPDGLEESIIRRLDPSAQPIMVMALDSKLEGGELFDLASEKIKPLLEQVNQVGLVEIIGGRKREIQVQVNRDRMKARELSVTQIAGALKNSGQNVPAGKIDQAESEMVFRTLGEFNSLDQIKNSIVSFYGNDAVTKVSDIGTVTDTLETERLRVYLNGEKSLFLNIYKQSGTNTVAVAKDIYKKLDKINEELSRVYGKDTKVIIIRDATKFIWANVVDVGESIIFGIILTILVVYLFLGSTRSTIITGFAIPVSLIGSFALFAAVGLTINIMSLLAFSLAVGLLIDDAIVVRENIFRHLEMGKSPSQAALDGTAEVGVAVLAVTLAVLAVFAPIAFLSGVVGQFFKSFGLGVCFVMIISLFDALSNAPMLSAYFGGSHETLNGKPLNWKRPIFSVLVLFDRLQNSLENGYEKLIKGVLQRPFLTLAALSVLIVGLASSVIFIPKTFIPTNDSGEFTVALELDPGSTIDKMTTLIQDVEKDIKQNPTVDLMLVTVGDTSGRSYVGDIYVKLTPFGKRTKTTSQVKEETRDMLKKYAYAKPKVKDVDFVGAGQRPFVINIVGQDLAQVREVSQKLFEKLKNHKALIDPEISDKPGLPEFQISIDKEKAQSYGVTPLMVGGELRAQVEGVVASKFREKGLEYDIRVKLQEDQRDLEKFFPVVTVPNLNYRPVYVRDFASYTKEVGFATINRENRGRYVSIEADVNPKGPGMGGAIQDIKAMFASGEVQLPEGVTYRFVGQAENFQELGVSMINAGLLAIVFIFLVLASLYESIVTPFAIMLVIPFAIFGGFFGLFVMHSTLDLFSMIGCIMLMGLATKNSIILIDYINQKLQEGVELNTAIVEGCKTRLRPILMTTLALIAGMMPVAIGLNEASSQRKSLGIAVVGGVIISTILTLILMPAVFSYIERARRWMIRNVGSKMITSNSNKHVELEVGHSSKKEIEPSIH